MMEHLSAHYVSVVRDIVPTVMVDLDSTVANIEHRVKLAPDDYNNGDWIPFALASYNDKPIEGTIRLINLLFPSNRIVICSGRSHVALEMTVEWLDRYGVPFDEMFLHNHSVAEMANGDYKVIHVRAQRARGFEVVLFLEDWGPTAQRIEEEGVPVLCVNPRYPGAGARGPREEFPP